MNSIRVILDTNLWISFLISKRLSAIDQFVDSGEIKLIFSRELIDEFIVVANRQKFKKYFSRKEIEQLLRVFDDYGEMVKVQSREVICRDLKDNFLINLAIDGNVDFLVTGDEDLLVLKKVAKTKIISFKYLLEFLNSDL